MEIEELFLTFACLLLFFDLIQLLKAKPREKRNHTYGFYASVTAFGLVVVSYVMLLQAFLEDDFALKAVYLYSSSGLPQSHKVYATWAGMSGSMLFLTFLLAITYFAYRFKTYEARGAFPLTAYKVLNCMLLFFLVLTLMNSPFERLEGRPLDGQGLNPLLQTLWMFVHPPVVFSGYVFVIFGFALVLARMKTKQGGESRLMKLSFQAAWLLLTLGNVLGALWAYEVLGWGGYWSWDPVETASLLPWLALTAYFHLGPISERSKSLTKELMLLLAFTTVIFTTALTRGGLLLSVHAFGTSPLGPVLLFFAFGVIVYFFYLKKGLEKPLFSLRVEKSSLSSVSFFAGYWSLIFIFLVCFWGVAFPVIGGMFQPNLGATSPDFYSNWNFPFVLAFVAALVGCSLHEIIGFKEFTGFVGCAVVVGIVLVLLRWPTSNVLANFGIPLLVVALVSVMYKLSKTLLAKKRSTRVFGRSLLHLAIVVTLLGVFVSSTAKVSSGIVSARPNTTVEQLGLEIELKNFTIIKGVGSVYSIQWNQYVPEYSALKLDIVVKQGNMVYEEALWIRRFTISGVVSPPLIIATWTGDIYLRLLNTESIDNALWLALNDVEVQPEDLMITVDINPMVHLVWAGSGLMALGMTLSLAKGIASSRRT